MDHIHAMSKGMEKFAEYTEPLYIAFIEYEKAFDSVETSATIQALQDQGLNEHYVKLLQGIYNIYNSATLMLPNESSKIPIGRASEKEKQSLLCYSQHVYNKYSENYIEKRWD